MWLDYLMVPAMNSLLVTAILMIIIIIKVSLNLKQILKENAFQQILLLSVLTSAFGMRGMLHLTLEKQYGLNPRSWF